MSDQELDLCTLALLSDLDTLDAGIADDGARQQVIASALQSAEALARHGGGCLGMDRINALLQALRAELAPCG